MSRVPFLLVLLIAGGCSQPLYTGPSFLNSRDPLADRQRFERFDPLPSEDLGPETYTRPPGFEEERPQPRRAAEARQLLGVPTPAAGTPRTRVTRNDYADVVAD